MEMATKSVTLNRDERNILLRMVFTEWKEADQERMGTIPGSDRERRAEEYQIMLSNLQAKLQGAVDEL